MVSQRGLGLPAAGGLGLDRPCICDETRSLINCAGGLEVGLVVGKTLPSEARNLAPFKLPPAFRTVDGPLSSYSQKPPLLLPFQLLTLPHTDRKKWESYLSLVYGHILTADQLLSVRLSEFDVLYVEKLRVTGLLTQIAPFVAAPTLVQHCNQMLDGKHIQCPQYPKQAYTCNTPRWDMPQTIFLFYGIGRGNPTNKTVQERLPQPVRSNSWIEVAHCSFQGKLWHGDDGHMTFRFD